MVRVLAGIVSILFAVSRYRQTLNRPEVKAGVRAGMRALGPATREFRVVLGALLNRILAAVFLTFAIFLAIRTLYLSGLVVSGSELQYPPVLVYGALGVLAALTGYLAYQFVYHYRKSSGRPDRRR